MTTKEERYKRHHDALRENLMKRKTQQRGRRESIKDEEVAVVKEPLPLQTPRTGEQDKAPQQ